MVSRVLASDLASQCVGSSWVRQTESGKPFGPLKSFDRSIGDCEAGQMDKSGKERPSTADFLVSECLALKE